MKQVVFLILILFVFTFLFSSLVPSASALALDGQATDPSQSINNIFAVLIGLSGSITIILIIIAGYRFMKSRDKSESLQQAREQLIAAIVGVVFLIFSLVILQVIGKL